MTDCGGRQLQNIMNEEQINFDVGQLGIYCAQNLFYQPVTLKREQKGG